MSRLKEPYNAIRADKRRSKAPHPYAAIDHRVIDSPAFCDLKNSSVRLLLLIARQLDRHGNNGHLQATWSYCRSRGIGSETTLKQAIEDLIAHQLIYRTLSSGTYKQWARYAVTWLPIKNSKGLYLHGWMIDSWRSWDGPKKNTRPRKLKDSPPAICSNHLESPSVSEGKSPTDTDDYELVPSTASPVTEKSPDQNREGSE